MGVDLEDQTSPDVADIERGPLEFRHTGAPLSDARGAFNVVIPLNAWERIHEHAHSRLDVEVGGVLLGKMVAADDGTPYLVIEAGVPALAAESRETNITFTGEAWTRIHELIDREHPGATIVGWYHTHPSFGIFLSDMDVFIQRHFFDLPHQVAIVVDPVAHTHGCFIWRSGMPTLSPLTIEGVKPRLAVPAAPPPPVVPASATRPPLEDPFRRSWWRPIRRRLVATLGPVSHFTAGQWLALLSLVGLALLLFGTLVVMWLGLSPGYLFHQIRFPRG